VAAALIAAGLAGAIVNISSTAGLVADASEPSAHYNASKAGVLALTRQMAAEWAPHGIRANAVCPGVIDTPMLRVMDDPAAGAAYLRTGVPHGRLGSADEVAAVVVFMASDDASYLTGACRPGGRRHNCDLRSSQMNQFPHVRVEGAGSRSRPRLRQPGP
jgi:NAD(P)-dependent dehydrogenase (short-subunit alcohol dehydrogenase family)